MRVVSTLFVVVLTGIFSAWGQGARVADDVRKGHHLATLLCTACHVVAPDQNYPPTLSPPAPSFASIAQRKDVTAKSLKAFLLTTRDGLDDPKGMPSPNLADFQVRELVAYILSLGKQRSGRVIKHPLVDAPRSGVPARRAKPSLSTGFMPPG